MTSSKSRSGEDIHFARFQGCKSFLGLQWYELHPFGIIEHCGCDSSAQIHIETAPVSIAIHRREPQQSAADPADEGAALFTSCRVCAHPTALEKTRPALTMEAQRTFKRARRWRKLLIGTLLFSRTGRRSMPKRLLACVHTVELPLRPAPSYNHWLLTGGRRREDRAPRAPFPTDRQSRLRCRAGAAANSAGWAGWVRCGHAGPAPQL